VPSSSRAHLEEKKRDRLGNEKSSAGEGGSMHFNCKRGDTLSAKKKAVVLEKPGKKRWDGRKRGNVFCLPENCFPRKEGLTWGGKKENNNKGGGKERVPAKPALFSGKRKAEKRKKKKRVVRWGGSIHLKGRQRFRSGEVPYYTNEVKKKRPQGRATSGAKRALQSGTHP